MNTWFEELFGFREGPYEWTKEQFKIDGDRFISRHNNRQFKCGNFSTPSVSELRKAVRPSVGPSSVSHEIIEDALLEHAHPENAGNVFQVASQFNCLEFPSAESIPEDGISDYAYDKTQGPACSLAAAAGTVYRNYFVPQAGQLGQTASHQINNLQTLETMISGGPFWKVENGYVDSSEAKLRAFDVACKKLARDNLIGAVRVGVHSGLEVTFADRFTELHPTHEVSQIFCAAISCAYSRLPTAAWETAATIALDAAYEGTLLATAKLRDEGIGDGTVWLTFIGGGVFGNTDEWIYRAMDRAIKRSRRLGLAIKIGHYKILRDPFERLGL